MGELFIRKANYIARNTKTGQTRLLFNVSLTYSASQDLYAGADNQI